MWLGDSFAEISFRSASDPSPASSSDVTRWFHPKKSPADGLREALQKIEASAQSGDSAGDIVGEIVVATSRAEMAIARHQGSEPVVLVTAGFETWLRAGHATVSSPSLRATRPWFPTSADKVFGIQERTRHDGTIERALSSDEFEFLVAKIELLKTKEIAIAFLHADRFPEHEQEAAAFFRARGFHVTCSHEISSTSHLSEIERVRRTVESAFAEAVIQEDFASLQAVLKEKNLSERWSIQFWTPKGVTSTSSASAVRGGVEAALLNTFGPRTNAQDIAYFFGIEEFLSFQQGQASLLPVQPTAQIGATSWPFPVWTNVDRGYEPGPMLFGKSHQLTLLDVLFVRDRLKGDIEGFSDLVQAKSSARILEALFTLGKNLAEPGRRAADAKEIAEDLESGFIERIAMDLALKGATSVIVAGPLAPTMVPLLEKRRPDIKFKIDTQVTIASATATPKAH